MKTTGLDHQSAEVEEWGSTPNRALFWDMGTGKTWVALATAENLLRDGRIDGMLVIAPNGVHVNWVTDEIPKHMDDDSVGWVSTYSPKTGSTKAFSINFDLMYRTPRTQLAIMCIAYSALRTKTGRAYVDKFMKERKCLLVIDEATRIKTPKARRTKVVMALAKKANYRRALTGTPVTNSAFDVYTIVKFLDPGFWKRSGFGTLASFRSYFGIYEEGYNGATGKTYKSLVGYRHLDELQSVLKEIGTRVLKDEVLNLPPKVFTKLYVELSPAQESAYKQMKKDSLMFLKDNIVSTNMVMVRMLRLQQILCGFVTADDGEVIAIDGKCKRVAKLVDYLQDVDGKVIIWARFTRDIDNLMIALGKTAVRYDGTTPDDDRLAARRAFQDDPDVRFFVGNPQACATGLTLTAANTVVYYSNNFRLEDRLQSEDRAHRYGQKGTVVYVDVVAKDTVDEHIVNCLRDRKSVAEQVTGDNAREWI